MNVEEEKVNDSSSPMRATGGTCELIGKESVVVARTRATWVKSRAVGRSDDVLLSGNMVKPHNARWPPHASDLRNQAHPKIRDDEQARNQKRVTEGDREREREGERDRTRKDVLTAPRKNLMRTKM